MGTEPVTVLLTCVGGTLSAEVARAIKTQQELPVRLVGVDAADGGGGRDVVDVFYRLPEGSAPDYVRRLHEICQREGVRVLIPYADEEVEAVAASRLTFDTLGVRCAVCDLDTVRLLRHKSRLFSALERAGISVAPYRVATTPEELAEAVSGLGYPERPVVVKPCVSRGGRGVWIVGRGPHRIGVDALRALPLNEQGAGQGWIAMEYLPGPAYDVDVLCDRGQVACLSVRRRYNNAGIPFQGCVTERHEPIERQAEAIVAACRLEFCIDIDMAMSETGEPRVLEVNPRMSGSVIGALRAGVNYPLEIVRMALGFPVARRMTQAGVETGPP